MNQQQGYPYTAFIMLTPDFLLLHGPVLWLYVKTLEEKRKLKRIDLVHFIPFVLFIINLALRFWFIPEKEKIELMTSESFQSRWTYYFFVTVIAISIPTYLFFGLVGLVKYQKWVKDYYSTIDNINLNWLKNLFLFGLILYSTFGLLHITKLFLPIISYKSYQEVSFITASGYILILGFFGHQQTSLFHSFYKIKSIAGKPSHIKPDLLFNKLETIMDQSKPYLNPELTIADLANLLEMDTGKLSEYLNKTLKQNFHTFINRYRIHTFKNYVESNKYPEFNIMGIAKECGFSSKATFNRVFKDIECITPKAYIQGLKKKRDLLNN
jgi:AraC-like DNA-binding protein